MVPSAEGQCCLDIDTEQDGPPISVPEIDPIDAALAENGGDARATISMLLQDCDFLRTELSVATRGVSRGMVYGRTFSFERARS